MPTKSTKSPIITASDLTLFSECPRCFYLAKIFHIKRPAAQKKEKPAKSLTPALKERMKTTLSHGAPLQNRSCQFCKYRQLVRATGVENEITA